MIYVLSGYQPPSRTEATLKPKKRKTVAERTILNIITQHLFKDIIMTNEVPDPTWILLIKSYDYEFQTLYRVTIICISLFWFGLTWVPASEWVGVWTKKRSGHCSGHIVDFRLSLKKKRQSVAYNSIFSSLFQSHSVQSHISKGKDFNLSVTTVELNGVPFILVHSFFAMDFCEALCNLVYRSAIQIKLWLKSLLLLLLWLSS